jgi:hypothetical protein
MTKRNEPRFYNANGLTAFLIGNVKIDIFHFIVFDIIFKKYAGTAVKLMSRYTNDFNIHKRSLLGAPRIVEIFQGN